ncbi:hypothetical protein FOB41_09705 [Agrobacterium pusense]|uniref:Uncharacterized protein n=3 Tax=Agrobacterium pusense TaxID=648995 RepID=A0A6H0ZMH5_9HYPH|nr:HNH endonuclease [Agrobacterium pusense]QIX21393.1 hypothetical protein FOB41_09705 [Agrobacterium pusense]
MKVEDLTGEQVALLMERFLEKTKRVGECLEWQGYIQNSGYGVLERRIGGKRIKVLAHRFAAKYIAGLEVDDICTCHKCDNRRCVDENHLFAGTHKENMQDAVAKGRQAKGGDLPHTKLNEEQVHLIREDDRDYETVATAYSVPSSTVSNIKNLIEWSHVPVRGSIFKSGAGDRIAGEAHYCAKLDEAKVIRIRTSTEPLGKLAVEFGVAYNTVHSALVGKTWRRVTVAANDNRLADAMEDAA